MRRKLIRFKDNQQLSNVLEPGKPHYEQMKGNWGMLQFGNSHPLVLELGCGNGVYTTGLAEMFPGRNFIGVDIKGARLWVGSHYALQHGLRNVAFLRTQIEHLDRFFVPGEVEEIYITFPDPRPRARDAKRRLTSARFLALYSRILAPGAKVHLKTDSAMLFDYTGQVLQQWGITPLISIQSLYDPSEIRTYHHTLQTPYEKRFLEEGKEIKYMCFCMKEGMLLHK